MIVIWFKKKIIFLNNLVNALYNLFEKYIYTTIIMIKSGEYIETRLNMVFAGVNLR